MAAMFSGASVFSGDPGRWNVSSVRYMTDMLHKLSTFNSDISERDVSRVMDIFGMLSDVQLSSTPYDTLLNVWRQLALQNRVKFSAGSRRYSEAGRGARQSLMDDFGWIINDGNLLDP